VAGDAFSDGRDFGAQAAGLALVAMAPRSGPHFIWLVAAALALWLHAPAQAQDLGQHQFRRGLGISHVMAWAARAAAPSHGSVLPPFTYADATFTNELRALRRAGFDFVRFAVDPGPFLQWRDARRDYLERMLIGRVRQILASDLSVIVDFHPSDMHP